MIFQRRQKALLWSKGLSESKHFKGISNFTKNSEKRQQYLTALLSLAPTDRLSYKLFPATGPNFKHLEGYFDYSLANELEDVKDNMTICK